MAAPDFTSARAGQVNSSGSDIALFLKVFGAEVFAAYKAKVLAVEKHFTRTITSGKSATFPVFGTVNSAIHTPGSTLVGQTINHNEREISIDGIRIADVFIPSIDELMNHFDLRAPYANECAYALAKVADQQTLQVAVNAARASATVTGGNGGTTINKTNAATVSADLVAAITSAAQAFDEKNLPDEDRNMFVRPAQYWLLNSDNNIMSKDYTGAGADRQKGALGFGVAGWHVLKTNHIPSTDITTGITTYRGDFDTTIAVGTHPTAVGTLKLLDLVMESEWQIRQQGFLTLAKYAMGQGILRPEAAVEIRSANPS